jgi:glycosyltransferase involved in cell wall biosynthesis
VLSIVINTPDVVGNRMAGPGIRAWNLAKVMRKDFAVTLVAALEHETLAKAPFPVLRRGSRAAREAMRQASVLVGQPARGFHRFRRGQRIVFDLFDPVLLELREMYGRHPSPRQRIHFFAEQWRLRRALADGDLLVCATPAQRELYSAAGDRLVEVPFGVDLDEVAPPEEREDVIVWGGGMWEWLDPGTAVDAVVRLNHEGIDCRLLFLGRNRPNRALAGRRRENRVDQLLAAGHAFLMANDEWVPYGERLSWLRRAKIAMMLHHSTAEARYSIRTRLFDAIAAATPVIATREGFAADLVAQEGLGIVVPASNADAVAEAAHRLLRDDVFHAQCVSNLERIRPRFAWPAVARPLIEAASRWQ